MEKTMKRFVSGVMAGMAGLMLAVALAPTAFAADTSPNSGVGTEPAVVTAPKFTNGSVKCTAAINSDGSVLSCKHCNAADISHTATGEYSIGFNKPCQNILAYNGWSRWVQVDDLSNGEAPAAVCTTADRFLDANAIWVHCWDLTGASVDTPFFLFVAK
jgi:hypothetical protein